MNVALTDSSKIASDRTDAGNSKTTTHLATNTDQKKFTFKPQ
jgi:hypothetical protein